MCVGTFERRFGPTGIRIPRDVVKKFLNVQVVDLIRIS